mgnify:CR=1 FL=1
MTVLASEAGLNAEPSEIVALPVSAGLSARHPGWVVGILAGLAAGALWGMVFVAQRTVPGFAAEDFAVWRYLACGVFSVGMLCVPLVRGQRPVLPTWRQAGAALWLTVLGYTGYYLLLVMAIERAGSVLPTLIIGTIPIWVMVLGKPHGLLWRGLLPGLVLTVAGGAGTAYLHEKLKVGDALTVSGPYGRFFVRSSSNAPVLFMAGGSGLSSPRSMILDLLEQGYPASRVGAHLRISPRTVENHRAQILQKLNLGNTTQMIRNVAMLDVLRASGVLD